MTIRDLTGSVTKINTRATTISDWDRKEIIVPNKAFITEQFINWSLGFHYPCGPHRSRTRGDQQ